MGVSLANEILNPHSLYQGGEASPVYVSLFGRWHYGMLISRSPPMIRRFHRPFSRVGWAHPAQPQPNNVRPRWASNPSVDFLGPRWTGFQFTRVTEWNEIIMNTPPPPCIVESF